MGGAGAWPVEPPVGVTGEVHFVFLFSSTQAALRWRLQKDLAIGCRAAGISPEDQALLAGEVARSVDARYGPWIPAADGHWLTQVDTVRLLLDRVRDDPSADLSEAFAALKRDGMGRHG